MKKENDLFKNLSKMCSWERQKAMYLVDTAENLDMDIDGYGELAVNPNSGNTYLWLDEYPFTLFMPIHCDLKIQDITAVWSNPKNGEEWGMDLKPETDLADLQEFVENCEKGKTENYDQY